MTLSRDGKCILIALLFGERIELVGDTICVVMNNTAFVVNSSEFDFLEDKRMIAIEGTGCRLTGRGRAWAKRWSEEIVGADPVMKAKVARLKSLSRVRLRRGNRRGR